MPPRPMLLCTVGTSLFFPNLNGLRDKLAAGALTDDLRPLAEAYRDSRWDDVADLLAPRDPAERLCGAEVNSITSLVRNNLIPADAGLFFFHSATDDGRAIAAVLVRLYSRRGHSPVEAVEIADLQDQDPKRFRTHGLRNLARQICRVVRERLRRRLRLQRHRRLQGPGRHSRPPRPEPRHPRLLHARALQRNHRLPAAARLPRLRGLDARQRTALRP